MDRTRQSFTPSGGVLTLPAPDNRSKAVQVGVRVAGLKRFIYPKSVVFLSTDPFTISLYLVYIILYTYTYELYRLIDRFAGLAGLVSQLSEFRQRQFLVSDSATVIMLYALGTVCTKGV